LIKYRIGRRRAVYCIPSGFQGIPGPSLSPGKLDPFSPFSPIFLCPVPIPFFFFRFLSSSPELRLLFVFSRRSFPPLPGPGLSAPALFAAMIDWFTPRVSLQFLFPPWQLMPFSSAPGLFRFRPGPFFFLPPPPPRSGFLCCSRGFLLSCLRFIAPLFLIRALFCRFLCPPPPPFFVFFSLLDPRYALPFPLDLPLLFRMTHSF